MERLAVLLAWAIDRLERSIAVLKMNLAVSQFILGNLGKPLKTLELDVSDGELVLRFAKQLDKGTENGHQRKES